MSVNKKIAVIIPVFNHVQQLPHVLEGVCRFISPDHVLVVDDGSNTSGVNTPSVIAARFQVQFLRQSSNSGKGAALRSGFDFWKREGIKWAITLDADGQHDTKELAKFIRAAELDRWDLVIGKRDFVQSNMPHERKLSNKITSKIISRLAGRYIPDSQCGYRLVRLAGIPDIQWREDGYAFESELLLRMAWRRTRIAFLPIKTIYNSSTVSSMKPFADTLRFIRMICLTVVKP